MLKNKRTLTSLLVMLWNSFKKTKKVKFYWLFFLTIMTGIVEVISLGTVVPFMGVLTNPEKVYYHTYMQPLINYFNISSPEGLIAPITATFCALALISGGVRIFHLKYLTVLAFNLGSDISVDIYRKTLYREYDYHIKKNSSEIIGGLTNKVHAVIFGVLLQLLTLFSSLFILILLLALLTWIDPFVTFISISIFILSYIVISLTIKERLTRNSEILSKEQTKIIKVASEGLGGIRDILIDGTQEKHCNEFEKSDRRLRKAQGINLYIGSMPRFLIEPIGMVLIAIMSYYLSLEEGGLISALPILAALALGAQRMLPLVQASYSSIVSIVGNKDNLADVLKLSNGKLNCKEEIKPFPFNSLISFKKLSYTYERGKEKVLKEIDLDINKGDVIGLIGKTGCGKSTFIDVLMGLLTPASGNLIVDGVKVKSSNVKDWQKNIAHVPQNIYLVDSSIINNIAFGILKEDVNIERVVFVAKQAQIYDHIMSLPGQFNENVGEGGVQLSGGQLQRIGIARALYKNLEVLILDEATSALDVETEESIIDAIHGLNKNITIIMIAHRLQSLRLCNRIIKFSNGRIESDKNINI
jgi:ATP-binding cassette, subfamily B, bacterial PglK